jgi:hypothetical protein
MDIKNKFGQEKNTINERNFIINTNRFWMRCRVRSIQIASTSTTSFCGSRRNNWFMDWLYNTNTNYILGGIMNNLLNDKTKAMLASYGRSVLGAGIALYMAGVTDPKDLWAALVAALAPVALRALNPNDKAFGVLPDTGAVSDALSKIVPAKKAPAKKKAAAKKK